MRIRTVALVLAALSAQAPRQAQSQSFPTDDPVIRAMWDEGVENGQTPVLAQALMDSIGPRLAGSPEYDASGDWLLSLYRAWDVPTRHTGYEGVG